MLSVLLKKQLTEIFRNYFYNPKTNKARSKAAVAAYIVLFAVLMVVILGGMFTVLSAALCTPLTAAGLDWLYFALMALLATLLGAFGSVFNTYSGLYLAKDNDLLLSMPIPVNTLMASRLLGVYLMGLMYSGVVMLPAVIVYWVATPAPTAAVIGGVLLVFLLSVFVLALSCALGWLVAKISQKLKIRASSLWCCRWCSSALTTSSISRPRTCCRSCCAAPPSTAHGSRARPIRCTCWAG